LRYVNSTHLVLRTYNNGSHQATEEPKFLRDPEGAPQKKYPKAPWDNSASRHACKEPDVKFMKDTKVANHQATKDNISEVEELLSNVEQLEMQKKEAEAGMKKLVDTLVIIQSQIDENRIKLRQILEGDDGPETNDQDVGEDILLPVKSDKGHQDSELKFIGRPPGYFYCLLLDLSLYRNSKGEK